MASFPLKAFFTSTPTPPSNPPSNPTTARSKRRQKVTKPAGTSTSTATSTTTTSATKTNMWGSTSGGSADHSVKKRPPFFSLLPGSSSSSSSLPSATPATTTSSSSFSSLLLLPAALFPPSPAVESAGQGPGLKDPKLKKGLFKRTNKLSRNAMSDSEQQPMMREEKAAGWSSRAWAVWGSGTTTGEDGISNIPPAQPQSQPPSLLINGVGNNGTGAALSKSSLGWGYLSKASKSDTDISAVTAAKQQQQRSRQQQRAQKEKSGKVKKTLLAVDDSIQSDGQIILHPSYNTSNRSASSPDTSLSKHASPGSMTFYQQQQQGRQCFSEEQVCTYQHQHQHQQRPSRMGVTLAVHDIFGLGKVSEMGLALFLAHDAFLSRRPFWLQCAILGWEALVVLLVVWTVMRVVGLAEVVVWGADDLVRGTVSLVQALGQAVRYLFYAR